MQVYMYQIGMHTEEPLSRCIVPLVLYMCTVL